MSLKEGKIKAVMNCNKDWIIQTKIDINAVKFIMKDIVGTEVDLALKSTRGFKCKQFDLFDKRSKFKKVINLIKDELCRLDNKQYNLLSAWTVIGQENNYHLVHKHNEPTNHLATVLYIKMPSTNNLHQSGEFYYFLKKDNKITYNNLLPEEGTLIIMPVHVLHGAYPQPKGIRQTLNLDFEVVDIK